MRCGREMYARCRATHSGPALRSPRSKSTARSPRSIAPRPSARDVHVDVGHDVPSRSRMSCGVICRVPAAGRRRRRTPPPPAPRGRHLSHFYRRNNVSCVFIMSALSGFGAINNMCGLRFFRNGHAHGSFCDGISAGAALRSAPRGFTRLTLSGRAWRGTAASLNRRDSLLVLHTDSWTDSGPQGQRRRAARVIGLRLQQFCVRRQRRRAPVRGD